MDKHDKREEQEHGLLLAQIEEQLKRRAQEQGELPWLSVSVSSEIEAREKAREWLVHHGSLFAYTPNDATIRDRLATLKSLTADIADVLTSKRVWSTIGAIAGGGLAGYIVGRCFPDFALLPAYSLAISLSALGAISAGLASQWQYLREYYL